jgi:hypothetical protein
MKYIVTELQYNLLVESLDKHFRVNDFTPRFVRRLVPMLKTVQDDLDWGVIDNSYPCEFSSVGEFIEESCDMLKDIYIDSISDIKVDSKDKDELYYYFLDRFSPYLYNVYKQKCGGINLKEEHSDKFEKYLIDYLNSFEFIKKRDGLFSFIFTSFEDAPKGEWTFMVWDEDYVDESGDMSKLRPLDIDPKMYSKIQSLFNIPTHRLNELILNWFNETYNETATNLVTHKDKDYLY